MKEDILRAVHTRFIAKRESLMVDINRLMTGSDYKELATEILANKIIELAIVEKAMEQTQFFMTQILLNKMASVPAPPEPPEAKELKEGETPQQPEK